MYLSGGQSKKTKFTHKNNDLAYSWLTRVAKVSLYTFPKDWCCCLYFIQGYNLQKNKRHFQQVFYPINSLQFSSAEFVRHTKKIEPKKKRCVFFSTRQFFSPKIPLRSLSLSLFLSHSVSLSLSSPSQSKPIHLTFILSPFFLLILIHRHIT